MDETATFASALAAHQSGQFDTARTRYQQILALNPKHFDSLHHLAIMAFQLGNAEDAVRHVDQALAVEPTMAAAHSNRGTFLQALNRHGDALLSFDRAIALNPNDAMSHNNRGVALEALGKPTEAIASFDRAIAINPSYAKAHCDRASVFMDLRRYDAAIADCRRAIALRPDFAEAHDTLGVALFENGAHEEALTSFDRALALRPDFVRAHRNRAGILDKLQRYEEAIASYDAALTHDPDLETARGARLHVSMHISAWDGFTENVADILRRVDAGQLASAPFPLLAVPSSPAQQRKIAARFYHHRTKGITPLPIPKKPPGVKIRVGYFSADFHNHATVHLMAGLLEHHDRTRFEVTAFQLARRPNDAEQERVRKAVTHFVDVSAKSDLDVAMLARDMNIDIAVDLMSHTNDARPAIFRYRAAPVQAGYLAYPGTMGDADIDYLITDAIVTPPDARPHYAEHLAILPHSYQINDDKKPISARSFTRRELNLPDGGFVFCCFNNAYKITPDVFDVWMNILKKVEGSVLWLMDRSETATRNLRAEAQKRDVNPGRLIFAGPLPLADHLARHRAADLFLDTFHYGAHTTASDALWTGLPVITKTGDTFASRVAASLLSAIDVPDLIAPDVAGYERLAVDLAAQPAKLAAIKERLLKNRDTCPLFDTARFTRNMEAAFQEMWTIYQSGDAARDFAVKEA